jgi:hypothetical protein
MVFEYESVKRSREFHDSVARGNPPFLARLSLSGDDNKLSMDGTIVGKADSFEKSFGVHWFDNV